MEVHVLDGATGYTTSLLDAVTQWPYTYMNQAVPLALDVNGDGHPDICFLTGVNDGLSASGHMEVHCLNGATNFTSSILDSVTQWPYTSTTTAHPVGVGMLAPASPSEPLGVVASPGNQTASVSFSPPLSNGRSSISNYTATASPGGQTASAVSSPIVVPGLTNGVSYTFTVMATNEVGTGPASAASNAVTPHAPPGIPTGVSAVPGGGVATVRWSAPTGNGGAAITGYVVTPYIGYFALTPVTFASTATTEVVTGLSNGTKYGFKVAAINVAGTGPPSLASAPVVVGAPVAPTKVLVAPGSTGTATGPLVVLFTPGANNGSAITSYTATCTSSNGGATGAKTGTASPVTVTGLTTAKTYTCTVKATNARGIGPQSLSSAPVVVGSPIAPTGVTAVNRVLKMGLLRSWWLDSTGVVR